MKVGVGYFRDSPCEPIFPRDQHDYKLEAMSLKFGRKLFE